MLIKPIKQAERLLKESQAVCPVRTGYLKSTGEIEVNENEVIVKYTADYAIYVHENPNGKGYKFLENTADRLRSEFVEEYKNDVVEEIKKSIRGGIYHVFR